MSVFDLLGHEHRLFQKMLDRIDRILAEEYDNRAELEGAVLLLFTSLDKHEAIEAALFGEHAGDLRDETEDWIILFDGQHKAIDSLRDQMASVEEQRCWSGKDFALLAQSMVRVIKRHLELEQERLWPIYARRVSRSLAHSGEHRAWKIMKELEEEVPRRICLLEEFLGPQPGRA